MYAIELINLTKKYGKFIALDNINLSVKKGIIFGLLGPNGAGKSTAIKIMTTFIKPTSGKVFIEGIDALKKPLDVRKIIGYVPQDISVIWELTALENMLIIGKLYNVKKQKVIDTLREIGLYDRKDDLVKNFSGGMVRKLEIASSIMHDPKVLFLDEPTIGLDPRSKKALWEDIKKLKSNGTTVLITTHDMNEAELLCDEIALLSKGKVVSFGTKEYLKSLINKENPTLEDVFIELTKETLSSDES